MFFGLVLSLPQNSVYLLQPAKETLGISYLRHTFPDYSLVVDICLMSLSALFFTGIISHHFVSISLGDNHKHVSKYSYSNFPSKDSGRDIITMKKYMDYLSFLKSFDDERENEEKGITSTQNLKMSATIIQDI